jgi:hypothetical protein
MDIMVELAMRTILTEGTATAAEAVEIALLELVESLFALWTHEGLVLLGSPTGQAQLGVILTPHIEDELLVDVEFLAALITLESRGIDSRIHLAVVCCGHG